MEGCKEEERKNKAGTKQDKIENLVKNSGKFRD